MAKLRERFQKFGAGTFARWYHAISELFWAMVNVPDGDMLRTVEAVMNVLKNLDDPNVRDARATEQDGGTRLLRLLCKLPRSLTDMSELRQVWEESQGMRKVEESWETETESSWGMVDSDKEDPLGGGSKMEVDDGAEDHPMLDAKTRRKLNRSTQSEDPQPTKVLDKTWGALPIKPSEEIPRHGVTPEWLSKQGENTQVLKMCIDAFDEKAMKAIKRGALQVQHIVALHAITWVAFKANNKATRIEMLQGMIRELMQWLEKVREERNRSQGDKGKRISLWVCDECRRRREPFGTRSDDSYCRDIQCPARGKGRYINEDMLGTYERLTEVKDTIVVQFHEITADGVGRIKWEIPEHEEVFRVHTTSSILMVKDGTQGGKGHLTDLLSKEEWKYIQEGAKSATKVETAWHMCEAAREQGEMPNTSPMVFMPELEDKIKATSMTLLKASKDERIRMEVTAIQKGSMPSEPCASAKASEAETPQKRQKRERNADEVIVDKDVFDDGEEMVEIKGGSPETREELMKRLKSVKGVANQYQIHVTANVMLRKLREMEERGEVPDAKLYIAAAACVTGGLPEAVANVVKDTIKAEEAKERMLKLQEALKKGEIPSLTITEVAKTRLHNLKIPELIPGPVPAQEAAQMMRCFWRMNETTGTSMWSDFEPDIKLQKAARSMAENAAPEAMGRLKTFLSEMPDIEGVTYHAENEELAMMHKMAVLSTYLQFHKDRIFVLAAYWEIRWEPFTEDIQDISTLWTVDWKTQKEIEALERRTAPWSRNPQTIDQVLTQERTEKGPDLYDDWTVWNEVRNGKRPRAWTMDGETDLINPLVAVYRNDRGEIDENYHWVRTCYTTSAAEVVLKAQQHGWTFKVIYKILATSIRVGRKQRQKGSNTAKLTDQELKDCALNLYKTMGMKAPETMKEAAEMLANITAHIAQAHFVQNIPECVPKVHSNQVDSKARMQERVVFDERLTFSANDMISILNLPSNFEENQAAQVFQINDIAYATFGYRCTSARYASIKEATHSTYFEDIGKRFDAWQQQHATEKEKPPFLFNLDERRDIKVWNTNNEECKWDKDMNKGRLWEVSNMIRSKNGGCTYGLSIKLECGMVMGMCQGWQYQKLNADGTRRRNAWQCLCCDGRWVRSDRASHLIRIIFAQKKDEPMPRLVEIVLGPPPQLEWKQHEERRIAYYLKYEQTAPLRDWVPPWTDIEMNSIRLTALPGVSDLIWKLVLGPQDERRTHDFYQTVKGLIGGDAVRKEPTLG